MSGNLIGTKIKGYKIIEPLGQGGMGVVYRARRGFRTYVVKTILPHMVDSNTQRRFVREVETQAAIKHPNIIKIYTYGHTDDGVFYSVMEYMPNGSLDTYLSGQIRMPLRSLFPIFSAIADGLDHTHHVHGFVHRDLKPGNILFDKQGHPKIADFGLVMETKPQRTSQLNLTQMGGMGTLPYMAPEQIKDARLVDYKADLYSFALIIYEVLTGSLPLKLYMEKQHGLNPAEYLSLLESALPPAPNKINRQLSREIGSVFEIALHPHPEQRFASAGELIRNLERAARSDSATIITTRGLANDKNSAPMTPQELHDFNRRGRESGELFWKVMGGLGRLILVMIVLAGCYWGYKAVDWGKISFGSGSDFEDIPDDFSATGDYTWLADGRHFSMSLDAQKDGDELSLNILWVDFNNTLTLATGKLYTDEDLKKINDPIEQERWRQVDATMGDTSSVWVKFTETQFISGNGVILNTFFYAQIRDGSLVGLHFETTESLTPLGTFILTLP